MMKFFNNSHGGFGTIGNKFFKLLRRSGFARKLAGNNVSVTFFKKILVTTTHSVNLRSFPYVMGFFAERQMSEH